MGLRRAGVPRWLLVLGIALALLTPAEAVLAAHALDTPAATLASPSHPAEGFTPGTRAVVRSDGQGLRVRSTPSITASIVTTLPEGTTVNVVDGRVSADGYWWQRIQAGTVNGWVAELYLRAAAPAPVQSSGGCPAVGVPIAQAPQPQPLAPKPPAPTLFGTIPRAGFGLVVWAGGTTDAVGATAREGGCALRSVWVSDDEGGLVGHLFGAPAFVNQGWNDRFPNGIPSNTPLVLVCGEPANVALISASVTAEGVEPGPALAVTPLAARPNIVPAAWALPPVAVRGLPPPTTGAAVALVMDGSSGDVMYQKGGERAVPPASTTKIATAILAAESGRLGEWVTVDVDSREMPGSSVMGLRRGDCYTLRDLLYGLMLSSGNDAALAIGRHLAGSDEAFVGQMNALLARLNLASSHFENPHGLHEPGHVASAHDLALLARYAMTIPDVTSVVGASRWTAQGSRTIPLTNTNAFLPSYPGADGVKTGFTEEAGRTLVASVTKNGRRVFVVVLNAPNRDQDAKLLFDWAFANYVWG